MLSGLEPAYPTSRLRRSCGEPCDQQAGWEQGTTSASERPGRTIAPETAAPSSRTGTAAERLMEAKGPETVADILYHSANIAAAPATRTSELAHGGSSGGRGLAAGKEASGAAAAAAAVAAAAVAATRRRAVLLLVAHGCEAWLDRRAHAEEHRRAAIRCGPPLPLVHVRRPPRIPKQACILLTPGGQCLRPRRWQLALVCV
jgi:hypothetical protein